MAAGWQFNARSCGRPIVTIRGPGSLKWYGADAPCVVDDKADVAAARVAVADHGRLTYPHAVVERTAPTAWLIARDSAHPLSRISWNSTFGSDSATIAPPTP